MNARRIALRMLACATLTIAFAAIANAQATRTWVSGVGDDVNPCSRTAPCKTFAGAISKTAANGEINALDPGGFGTITITKTITIDGTTGQGFGSILAAGTNGVIINDSATATPNTIVVRLRNLSIHGANTGFSGIRFLAGKAVHVENCSIYGFRGNGFNSHGIDVAMTAGGGQLSVKNTNIGELSGSAIRATTSSGTVSVYVENSTMERGQNGVRLETGSRALISNSLMANNLGAGIEAVSSGVIVDLDSSRIYGNVNGMTAASGTTWRLGGMRITNNTNGVNITGGTVNTYFDNKIDGNTSADVLGGALNTISKR